jgi:ABC-type glutathione transport system ATPase component
VDRLARMQLQDCLGDDPERAFAADEQVLQIEARGVLAQCAQAIPDPPVRQHDLEPEHLVARRAEAQHVDAAAIGRDRAADHRRAACAPIHGETAIDLFCGVVQRLQDRAGFRGDRVACGIDREDPVHPGERQDDAGPLAARHGAAAKSGVASLRHDRDAVPGADLDEAGDLLGRSRARHQERLAAIDPPHVDGVRGHIPGLEEALRAELALQFGDDSLHTPSRSIDRWDRAQAQDARGAGARQAGAPDSSQEMSSKRLTGTVWLRDAGTLRPEVTPMAPEDDPRSAQPGGPLLEARNLSKRFGGVQALQKVSFDLRPGEVLALAGDNGAGKSTLIKCISGVHAPDEGEILYKGKPVALANPREARNLGIETIYQDLALADNLDVGANVFLGREPRIRRLGVLPAIDRRRMRQAAREVLQTLEIELPRGKLTQPVRTLSGGQRQAVAIGRAIYWQAEVLIMDEPTAALGVPEQRKVRELIARLKQQKVGIIFISHNLVDIFAVADRILVLRRGVAAGERRTSETDHDEIVRLMIGAEPAAA